MRNVWRVLFPDNKGGTWVTEVDAHELTGETTVKHQVWLKLCRDGADVEPNTGTAEIIGQLADEE
ncbi:hypothetical protein CPT_Shady_046 [Streptomyces phage Shady]|uniref:Uncharacterized protein n=1 Tax=Streptomyces phage Shady TaxID=2767585 RepID=A0A873WE92_9CAUD|nr:hypothetical protein CPT_Shady_046 [Streptomyces phage Shady]